MFKIARLSPLIISALLLAFPSFAAEKDVAASGFVDSNVIATFYHELGHALIDVLELPVLGREEDAADSLSALLIHYIWDEDSASTLIADAALAFQLYHAESEQSGVQTPYWGEHSLDLQRFYNLVCLFYGADPDNRQSVPNEFDLPQDRAELCAAEFEQTERAWMGPLEQMANQSDGAGLVMLGDASEPIAALLASEVADFNAQYSLPTEVTVALDNCGETNAFYDPEQKSITLCREYANDLHRLWQSRPDQ